MLFIGTIFELSFGTFLLSKFRADLLGPIVGQILYRNGFAAIPLDAAILGVAVTTVPGRALTFLMCHGYRSDQPEMAVISISV